MARINMLKKRLNAFYFDGNLQSPQQILKLLYSRGS